MKIIDLLNKIANGEETPNKFKYDNLTFTKRCDGVYFDNDGDELHSSLSIDLSNLNDEIEIITEDKKIEKLTLYGNNYAYTSNLEQEFGHIQFKINELIDKVNNMENNK